MISAAVLLALLEGLKALPSLFRTGVEITRIIKSDPGAPEELKAKAAEIEAALEEAVKAVREAPLPVAR